MYGKKYHHDIYIYIYIYIYFQLINLFSTLTSMQSQPAGEHESMTIQAKIQSVRHIEEERENGTDNSTLLQVGQVGLDMVQFDDFSRTLINSVVYSQMK